MKSALQKVFIWLVVSSQDPNRVALTIKAGAPLFITWITFAAGLGHIQVGDLTPIVDQVITIVQYTGLVVTAAVTLWGLVRKTWASLQGQHAGINFWLK